MANILFLDDDQRRADEFHRRCPDSIWAVHAAMAIDQLHLAWDEIWLDHDLCGQVFVSSDSPHSGMEVVRFIERTCPEHLPWGAKPDPDRAKVIDAMCDPSVPEEVESSTDLVILSPRSTSP